MNSSSEPRHPADRAPPPGFVLHDRRSPLTEPWEPLYERALSDRLVLGLWLRTPHTNTRGTGHGGLIAALADKAMGLSCGVAMAAAGESGSGPVTASLAVDYLETARVGQWLVIDTNFVRLGRTLCFTGADITADGALVARAHATFRVLTVRG